MHHHVTLFQQNTDTSLSNCLLRDGIINFAKYAHGFLLLKVFSGGLVDKYQLNSHSVFLDKFFASSKFLLASLCSSHLIYNFQLFHQPMFLHTNK